MAYPILAVLFFLSMLILVLLLIGLITRGSFWRRNLSSIKIFCLIWFVPYLIFILFFTGPDDVSKYPPQKKSPYKLPWKGGVSRLVAQGNQSFTSHRDFHRYAWDFVMPSGTPILAARAGKVSEVEDSYDGIGLKSNYLIVKHEDGESSGYAHIQNKGSLVKVGDVVSQGQPIALSGVVGQTIFPHVHFYVINSEGTSSLPISFQEVSGGVPLAGHIYTSGNL